MIAINPGELREPIILTMPIRVSDGAGGSEATDSIVIETLAKIKALPSYSPIEADKIINSVPYEVTIRYANNRMPQVDNNFEWRGDKYRIKAIEEVDTTKHLIKFLATREL